MPFHDWTRVAAGTFHDFHYSWVAELRNALNRGLLPSAYYAQAEQVSGASVPDVHTRHSTDDESALDISRLKDGSAVAVAEHPPNVSLTEQAEEKRYARKRNRIAIRHRSGGLTIATAYVEPVSLRESRVAQS